MSPINGRRLFLFAIFGFWFILAVVFAQVASASMSVTGFLSGQFDQNGDTICVYDAMGHTEYINVGISICPLTIQANI